MSNFIGQTIGGRIWGIYLWLAAAGKGVHAVAEQLFRKADMQRANCCRQTEAEARCPCWGGHSLLKPLLVNAPGEFVFGCRTVRVLIWLFLKG